MVAVSMRDKAFDQSTPSKQLDYIHAHRSSFVGRLLIGVLSTGIYCLPSCTARTPKPENVRFFKSEEEAQSAGLRPCRRCRPDYFYRNYDPDMESLNALVDAINRAPTAFAGLESMAGVSGIGMTKLSALFRQHYHTSPAAYLSRVRLAAACKILADPDRQIIDVAYAAGYESLSAFHDNFRKAMGLSPKEYQCLGKETSFTITLPKHYLAWVTPKLLGRDPESVIERTEGSTDGSTTSRTAIKALTVGAYTVLVHLEWHAQYVHCPE